MYDGATYFAWIVLALLFAVAVGLIVWIGTIPKKIAMKRNHPQVDAINAASWIGLALAGVGWPIAFVWAFLRSGQIGHNDNENDKATDTSNEVSRLAARVAELEAQLKQLDAKEKR